MNYKVVKKNEIHDEEIDKYVCLYDYYNFNYKFSAIKYVDSNKANNNLYLKKILGYVYHLSNKDTNNIDSSKIFPFYMNPNNINGYLEEKIYSDEFATNSFGWGNVKAFENLFLLLSTNISIKTVAFPTLKGFNNFDEFDGYVMLIYRLAMKFCSKSISNIIFVADNDKTYNKYQKTIDIINDYKNQKFNGTPSMKLDLYRLENFASAVTDETETRKQLIEYELIPHDTYFDIAIDNEMTVDKNHKMLCMRDKTNPESKWMIPHMTWNPNISEDEILEYYDDGIYYDLITKFKEEYGLEMNYIGVDSYKVFPNKELFLIGILNLESDKLPKNDKFEFKLFSLEEIKKMDFEENSKLVVKTAY